jgi:hypothetical protein
MIAVVPAGDLLDESLNALGVTHGRRADPPTFATVVERCVKASSTLAQGFKTKDRTWHPDLEWIINATNFAKIIDGKYSK